MRIPDVEGLKYVHVALNVSNVTAATGILDNDVDGNSTSDNPRAAVLGQPQSVGRANDVLNAANGTSRTTPAEKHVAGEQALTERQSSCTNAKAFYKCGNGFTGCCSVNPCNPGGTCPDGQKASDEDQPKTSAQSSGEETSTAGSVKPTQTQSNTKTTTRSTADANTTTTGIQTASATGSLASTTSSRTPRPGASAPPDCPRANGKTYSDSFKISYRIRCASDNTAASFDSIAVGTGGYDQCFSACSQSEKCAGFTYVGQNSGNCYLKVEMPNGTYVGKQGNNYISCAKLHPDQSAGHDPNTGKHEPAKRSTGAIVGGVVGGVAFLGLFLVCIALVAKRRRKKIEDRRRGTVTHVFHGPIETDMTQQPPLPSRKKYSYAPGYGPGHQRQGSTSHDVFTPHGGNVYDPRTHTRQRSIYAAQQTWV